MSRFNTISQGTKTINLAGGQAYTMTPELELATLVLTSFVNDQVYRTHKDTIIKIQKLIPKCDLEFVTRLVVFARKEYGMRTITHVLSALLAKYLSGKQNGKKFYEAVINRPDDITEIISFYKLNNPNKALPAAMKKGFAAKINTLNEYQLAKYRMSNKEWKMVDVVNLVHPKPVENSEAIKKLMNDTLRSTDTWESMISAAGNEEDVNESKSQAWSELVKTKKIGYFALLRNLRNIRDQAPEVLDEALELLVDKNLIKKSLVLPFRFDTAYEQFKSGSSEDRKIIVALNKATDIAMDNVPELKGRTLVVVDSSGSMVGRPAQIASLFAAVLVKKNPGADLMSFATDARYETFNPMDSVLTIKNSFRFAMGGTNFHSIFQTANKPYDRVIILSDMQGWMIRDWESNSWESNPRKTFREYKTKYGVEPVVYSFDLAGYGTLEFPENNVYTLAGFSDKVFDTMKLLESDKNALINTINNYSI